MYAHGVTWGTKDGGESSRNIYVYVPRTAGPWLVSSLTGHRLELGMAGHPRNWTLYVTETSVHHSHWTTIQLPLLPPPPPQAPDTKELAPGEILIPKNK